MQILRMKAVSISLILIFMFPIFSQLNVNQPIENLSNPNEIFSSESNNTSSDAWLTLELISWQGNTSTTWDADGTDIDPQFQICIDLDGEADGISPLCTWTEVWNNTLTLSNAWETTFDLIEDNTLLNITIECWDNDEESDEWGNGPDACDMNPNDNEWRLYFEVNWSDIATETFSGDGSIGNDTQWGNAVSTWKIVVSYYGDEDNDGIYDNKDECPNTSDAISVDKWGCFWGDIDYDEDGIQNSIDPCPTVPMISCDGTDGNYSRINSVMINSLTGFTGSEATRLSPQNDYSSLNTYTRGCDHFEVDILNSTGGCKTFSKLTSSNGRYFAYLDYGACENYAICPWPTSIITHWGQLNFSSDYPNNLQLSDDGRFVIYRSVTSIYTWDNNSEPLKILEMNDNDEQGSFTNPGRSPKLSPDGQYFSLHWDSYIPPKPVYVYSLRDGSSSAVANCDSHDFAHKSSELICSNHDNVTIVDLESNEVVRTFKSDVVPATGIYYSPSDKFVMQYCRLISNGQGTTYCNDGDVKIQVTNLETGLSHYPEIVDSPSHYERINSGGFIYGDHTMFFGVEYYFIDKEGASTAQDENMIVLFGQDSDDDDVFDIYDECPKTSLMIGIDSNGCSSSQRDSDNDGLVDSLDQCPDTENGILVDDVGCWWGQLDTDNDGIQNSEDLCPESRYKSCEIPSKWHLSERSVVLRQCTQDQILSCEEDSSLTENYDPGFNVISEIEYSPDGSLFAIILNRDSIMIFDSQSKNQISRINISSAHSISFSNDGTILAIGGNANITLWDTSNWQQIGLIGEEGGDHITKISFSPDGRYLAYANKPPYVTRVIDLKDNSSGEGLFCHSRCAIVHNFTNSHNGVSSMDFSPDGSYFAISTKVDIMGEFDVGLIVFETSNWSIEFTDSYGQITDPPEGWTSSYNSIRDLQFTTNNQWLITGSMRGDIRVYDRSDWSIVGTFEIGMYGLEDFTISPDNNHVISSTTYRSGPPVVVLDLTNGNTDSYDSPCGYGIGSTGEIWSLAISNDGSEMIMGGVTCLNEDSNILTNSLYVFEGDSDGDGVLESFDICPNTELTDSVNSQGCSANQVDSDEDGVYDSQDLCSDTGSGVQVDQNGCASNQIDSDADGITDASDQCPNTPTGESVGLTGCSGSQVDTDEDGVYDSQDNCPSTPSGTTVDSVGCAPDDVVDLDSDEDGVRDSIDSCPNSATGIVVDSSGCEIDGDVQEIDYALSSEDFGNMLVGLFTIVVIIAAAVAGIKFLSSAAVAGIKSLSSSSNVDYNWDFESYNSVSSHTNPTPQPEPNLELQNIVAELERQRMQSEREINQLRQQQSQQSNASEIAAMQREMQALQRRVTDAEQAKLQLQNEIEHVKSQKDESIKMQDSVVGGDMVASGGQKIESQTNVMGTDPEAIARIIFEAQEKERERLRKERNE